MEHNSCAEEHGEAHEEEAALVVAGEVFGEADEIWAKEATEDADHVDGGNTGRGGAAFEEGRGQRPERALHGVVGEDEETESRNHNQRPGGDSADEEAERDEQAPGNDVPVSLTGVVGMYGVEQHAERTEETKAGDDKTDVGCAEMGGALDKVRRDEGISVEAGEH